ncbi:MULTISPECIES: RIP metalloprotease RseP [Persicobacter]|uniref:Zinc metalloprotease n=1 Tax=Persicobacter diffluens TaxID=981 RepID=A0AAN5AJR8_9BACT|nr:RIP metalloprotease RseP [Persicobacter sp. CCB-QB2]GJM61945.1 zinc metalloprotease [Persicobacter diffluens]
MEGLIMAAQMILGLSILVGVHELGHLVAAKVFGMRVEQYSIGFPPKLFSKKWGETEYSLSLIPLGGYVKISGMIDESLDKEQMNQEPQPWEFRSKPAWQRLIVMLGGIIVNVITGIFIFVLLTFSYGENYLSKSELNKNGIVAYDLAQEIGFRTGDKVENINGQDFERFSDLRDPELMMTSGSYYTVKRNGSEHKVVIPAGFMDKLATANEDDKPHFIDFRRPFTVGDVMNNSAASEAGLSKGDEIISINQQPIGFFDELQQSLNSHADKAISLEVKRGTEIKTLQATVGEDGKLGFMPDFDINFSSIQPTFGEAMSLGTEKAFSVVWLNIKAFGKIFTGELSAKKSLGGPIAIAQSFGGTWDWFRFWSLTGMLSMVLAFMNLLPIPALDGGHVMFLLFEMITGHKPGDKFLENAQKVGMVLLLGLMVFIFANDIIKLLPSGWVNW